MLAGLAVADKPVGVSHAAEDYQPVAVLGAE